MVNNDGWLNPEDEPVLSEMLEVAAALDRDSDLPVSDVDQQRWKRLFELADQLQ